MLSGNFLRHGNSARDFLGVKFWSRYFWGFWYFPLFDHPCHLKSPSPPGVHTNPGKKICGFKNLQIRVDGACIWKSMRIGYSKETGKSRNLYTVPWTGILTSFLTDRLSPEWMISVANNRHRVLRKPSSYPDKGNSFNSGNVTPSEFLKTVILIVQHRLF